MNAPPDSPATPPTLAPKPLRARSGRLAWAITIGECALLAGAAVPLIKYWLMLPAPIRIGAASVLSLLACLVILRLALYYRRRERRQENKATTLRRTQKQDQEPEPEPGSALPHLPAGKTSTTEIPCKKRLRNSTVLLPSGSSSCP